MNNNHFFAYFGGFFDGEGCVSVSGDKRLQAFLSVSQKRREPLDMAQEQWGGSIGYDVRSGVYQLQVCGDKSAQMARDILPYTIVKTRQLEWFIELREGVTYRNMSLSEEELENRRRLVSLIKGDKR